MWWEDTLKAHRPERKKRWTSIDFIKLCFRRLKKSKFREHSVSILHEKHFGMMLNKKPNVIQQPFFSPPVSLFRGQNGALATSPYLIQKGLRCRFTLPKTALPVRGRACPLQGRWVEEGSFVPGSGKLLEPHITFWSSAVAFNYIMIWEP